ncbi:hypothetical protein AB2M62_14935 [Sphingomonas sp. MMS12-HWE2-04]|uniref:hypothetical protein n=1 Tax=Sphingomonas sp. MMS12-HWE2-04 TaxID=3234199 RepID=UPI0038507424
MLEGALKDITDVRWYLPIRTPSDSHDEANWNLAVEGANRDMLNLNAITIPKIAHSFLIASGEQADAEAAPDLSFATRSDGSLDTVELGGGTVLRFDQASGTLSLENGLRQAVIWGGNQPVYPEVGVTLGSGTRVTIESGAAADHPDAVAPNRIAVTRDGRTTTLTPIAT